MEFCSPTSAAYDLDNRLKALFDAMEHAGVYVNDSQIDEIRAIRGEPVQSGCCYVWVEEMG